MTKTRNFIYDICFNLLLVVISFTLLASEAFSRQDKKEVTSAPQSKEGTNKPASSHPNKLPDLNTKTQTSSKDTKSDNELLKSRAEAELLKGKIIEQLEFVADDLKQISNFNVSLPLVRSTVKLLAKSNPGKCQELLETLFDKAEQQTDKNGTDIKKGNLRYLYQSQVRQIIAIASSFDSDLAQKFAERLSSSEKFAQVTNKTEGQLSAAKELINNNPQQALSIASATSKEVFTTQTLEFLSALRSKDPKLAKTCITDVLQNFEARKSPSINELLLVYSYIFLSRRIPIYIPEERMMAYMRNIDYGKDLDRQTIDAESAKRFLQLAASVVLQQERYSGIDRAKISSDIIADVIFIDAVLNPLLKSYAPQLADQVLQARNSLISSLDSSSRTSINDSVEKFNPTNDSEKAAVSTDILLQEAEDKKTDSEKRDKLYYEAACQAIAEKRYSKAIEVVEKIPDRKVKTVAKNFILFEIAVAELKSKNYDEAYKWIRTHEDPVEKAYVITLIAKALVEEKKEDVQIAYERLAEVADLVGILSSGTEKFVVLAGLASVYSRLDSGRGLEYLDLCVETANNTDKFDTNLIVQRTLYLNRFSYSHRLYNDNIAFNEVASVLAKDNLQSVLTLAWKLKEPITRARLVISACEAVK